MYTCTLYKLGKNFIKIYDKQTMLMSIHNYYIMFKQKPKWRYPCINNNPNPHLLQLQPKRICNTSNNCTFKVVWAQIMIYIDEKCNW